MTFVVLAVGVIDGINSIPGEAWVAIGTIIGGFGLKILEKWLNTNKDRLDTRRNLHDEWGEAMDRLDKVEHQVTVWREKFYAEQEQVALLRQMIIKMGGTLPEKIIHDEQNKTPG